MENGTETDIMVFVGLFFSGFFPPFSFFTSFFPPAASYVLITTNNYLKGIKITRWMMEPELNLPC